MPPALGQALRRLVVEHGDEFEALLIPFKHFFCGKWMEHSGWWPGYTRPQLLKKGRFRYNERLHSGVEVQGRTARFPADDPELAIVHLSYDNLHHYLEKLNRYTDGEAESLLADDASHSWQAQLAHFVHDWQVYYERGRADLDGMHGFVLAFMSAFYRFASRTKLWDLRRQQRVASRINTETRRHGGGHGGVLEDREAEPVPANLCEMIEFMAHVAQHGPGQWLAQSHHHIITSSHHQPVPLLWYAPLHDPSGYADEARNFVLGLIEAGEPLAVAPLRWTDADAGLSPEVRGLLDAHTVPVDTPAELFVSQMTPPLNRPSPRARFNIVRTMFETDRLQPGWEQVLNGMDRVWVPSEFNRETFVRSGVDPDRIAVVPGAIDPAPFAAAVEPWPVPGDERYRFLTVFDWTLHKGWDVLLEAFAREFEPGVVSTRSRGGHGEGAEQERRAAGESVGLILKVWSSNGYSPERIEGEADQLLRERVGRGLAAFPHIHLWQERIPTGEMPRLYRAVDAFVLATRGEGWCRPLMEAMAAGLPTIATAWSGLTAFHDAHVGYPLRCRLVPVSEAGGREIPIYAGHCWAEPDVADLRRLLRRLVERPAEARRKGEAARQRVARHYSRAAVAGVVRAELEHCRALAAQKAASPAPGQNGAGRAIPRGSDAILLQSARGEHVRLLDLTRARHQAYALRHGMDYLCCTDLPPSGRHPSWDKVALLLQAMRQGAHELLVWLDADTLIADDARDLRQALPPDKWLGMARHGSPPYFNCGVLYVRNTPEARALFEAVWANWPVDHPWEDNAAMLQVLEREPAWAAGIAALGDEWNSTLRVNESPRPVVVAWHGFGTLAARLASMQAAVQALEGRPEGRREAPAAAASGPGERLSPAAARPNAYPLARAVAAPVDFRACLGRPLRVRWEGDQSLRSSLALVNRELCMGLLAAGDVELTLVDGNDPFHTLTEKDDPRFAALFERRGAALSGPVDVTIRHGFPPDWRRPETGRLVVIQPWEYGHLPLDWVSAARDQADEVWAYSRFVRDVYARSGVPAEKVPIVPLGFNPAVFTPEGPRYRLPTGKSLRFLFVGGAIHRKGADLLLEAYQRAFVAGDDVALVVKDMGTQSFYRGQTLAAAFRRAAADPALPEVIYLDGDLSDAELAALYRACSCVVLPYRGEGFGLPPLEGMACGLPAIVTAAGPTDDYLEETMALRLPARRRFLGSPYVGALACAGDPWNLEPEPAALVDALRWARDHPEELRERGRAARAFVQEDWTWERSVNVARQRLFKLLAPSVQPRARPARLWAEPARAAGAGAGASSSDVGGHGSHPGHPDAPDRKPKRPGRSGNPKSDNPKPGRPGGTRNPGSPELSLCMIVRDEEPRIRSCLRSIAPYVDEMVVVDTGSTDGTRESARDCGARVYDYTWTDSFAEARNQSLALARGRWVFWMDADDVISPEAGRELRRLIARHPQQDAAVQAQVRIPPGPGEFSDSVVDHVKLFPNRPDLRFEHRIHEQILPSIRRAGLQVLFSDIVVVHQHYDRSPEGQARKRERDFRLLELDLRDRPDHPFVLFNLGMTHLYASKEYEVAAHYLRRSLDRSDWQDSIVRKAYAMLAAARLAQGESEAALVANEEGRGHYPADAELLFQAGQIYQELGRFDEARRCLERLVDGHDDPHYRSVDTGLRTYRGRHELALLFRRLGDPGHCEQVLRAVAGAHPAYLPARLDLAETLAGLGRPEQARAVLRACGESPAEARDRASGARSRSGAGHDPSPIVSSPATKTPPRAAGRSPAGLSPHAPSRIPEVKSMQHEQHRPNGLEGNSPRRRPGAAKPVEPAWEEAPEFGRRETLLRALRRLYQLCPGPACVVETGTLRNDTPVGREGDGWATVAWGWYCTQTGGKAITIDINPAALEICRRATARYAAALEYVQADSVQFLNGWDTERRGKIDLLYLDSFDYEGGQQEESVRHHLAEAEAALPALGDPCLALIDDTTAVAPPDSSPAPLFAGKGARAVPFLLAHGFRIEWAAGVQVLLSRGVPAGLP